ncbi:MAG: hypothetical protein U1A27_06865 [Phycisphaerae bacterium]
MVIDVHCHAGLSARRADRLAARYSFEPAGATGTPGYDSYLSPRLSARLAWRVIRRWLRVGGLPPGDALDARLEALHAHHWQHATGVDRLVLLAFDEYHDDAGTPIGMAPRGAARGSDLYVSNSCVADLCRCEPGRFLFGASLHPYRRDAIAALEELAARSRRAQRWWLPIHQNIAADDAHRGVRGGPAGRAAADSLRRRDVARAAAPGVRAARADADGAVAAARAAGELPTVIVAHAATPSFAWQSRRGHAALVAALQGEFATAALRRHLGLSALGRTRWLTRLAARPELHAKLLWGQRLSDLVMTAGSTACHQARARRVRHLVGRTQPADGRGWQVLRAGLHPGGRVRARRSRERTRRDKPATARLSRPRPIVNPRAAGRLSRAQTV